MMIMVDQVELLPCPFCGKTPALVNEGNGDHARHDWDDCLCDGLMVPVDEWNTRTAYNPNERLREALEERIRIFVWNYHKTRGATDERAMACVAQEVAALARTSPSGLRE